MSRNHLAAIVATFAVLTASSPSLAASDTLTNERAQHAINNWLPGNGQKTVLGVLEIPAQNAARADLTLRNLDWVSSSNDPITAYAMGPGGGHHIYNGRAEGIFVHYTDGRWILISVQTQIGNFENLSIPAQ